MRFELLRQRVERAERRTESCMDRADSHRFQLAAAWRRGWSPGRIVVAGLVSGFLVGRSEPLSKVGGTRWLQLFGTVSGMLASLRAAAASENADAAASEAAEQASVAADAATDVADGSAPGATAAPQRRVPTGTAGVGIDPVRAPAPAEAATDVSER